MTECAVGSAVGGDDTAGPTASRFDPAAWRKASASEPNGGNCVEVNFGTAGVGLRDSKLTDGPEFVLALGQWQAFATAVTSC